MFGSDWVSDEEKLISKYNEKTGSQFSGSIEELEKEIESGLRSNSGFDKGTDRTLRDFQYKISQMRGDQ